MLDTSGKSLERILLQRITDHWDSHDGLNKFGFRQSRSTEDAITKIINVAIYIQYNTI